MQKAYCRYNVLIYVHIEYLLLFLSAAILLQILNIQLPWKHAVLRCLVVADLKGWDAWLENLEAEAAELSLVRPSNNGITDSTVGHVPTLLCSHSQRHDHYPFSPLLHHFCKIPRKVDRHPRHHERFLDFQLEST